MMQHEMVQQPPEQLPIEEISSPLNAQIFDFCESELFPETLQNSEVASNSNCCYEEHSSYSTNLSLTPEMNKYTNNNSLGIKDDTAPETATTTTTTTTTTTQAMISSTISTTPGTTINTSNINHSINHSNLSVIFDDSPDDLDNDISVSIDFSTTAGFIIPQYLPNQQDQFDYSSLNNRNSMPDVADCSLTQFPAENPVIPFMGHTMPPVYEDECLSAMPPYMRLNNTSSPSCSLLDPSIGPYLPSNLNAALAAADSAGIFSGGCLFLGNEMPPQELDYQGENGGIFCPDTLPRAYNCSADLQAISNESNHFVNGTGNSTPLASEISSLEDPTFKVGKLTVEERREKIHRYMKKRNERNFSKKIKVTSLILSQLIFCIRETCQYS
ncbi:OLC1v1019558C1 [Oldenlandia corymbosa var. corymbosa]|uniref:OLC1v1019558C1 n=1 Tax=Oldenlandia corymbosa var. corymbosa TaxID=529605 RepID=A0AAV1EE91_OLDCO|nr:OLC1v1019558C1 [Oldenlandia corymbosa var. corymbosa]